MCSMASVSCVFNIHNNNDNDKALNTQNSMTHFNYVKFKF